MRAFSVIIPARYASTRLPGKPLLEIAGKPMLQHVHERALASGAERVLIATDDARIAAAAEAFGASCCMTASTHQSGTDRLAEVVAREGFADDRIVVNVQGDEPLIPPSLIQQVAQGLAQQPQAAMSTLCSPLQAEDLTNPNVVKLVRDKQGFALYFSRAPIPFLRDADHARQTPLFRHIGLYAYRAAYLTHFAQLPVCDLEADEALEQLRVLHDGARIFVEPACELPPHGVDTAEDLQRVRALLEKQS